MTKNVNTLIDEAVEAIQAATRAQRYGCEPTHIEFYAWGWGLSAIAIELASLAVVLEHQVRRYPSRWQLRDDAGAEPSDRIAGCTALLSELASALGSVSHVARGYHGEMGHVAVDDDRWTGE